MKVKSVAPTPRKVRQPGTVGPAVESSAQEAAEPAIPNAMAAAQEETDEETLHKGKMDMATLMDAEHIKGDPKRMAGVKAHHAKHMTAVHSIQDLKDMYNAKFGDGKTKVAPKKKMGM